MKKTLKGILAIAFVFTLIFGMGMTVYADTPEYKITVENKNSNISISGKEYKAYKVFDLTLGSITYSQANEYAANQTYYVYDSTTNKYTAANITESEFNNGTYYTMSVGAYAYTVKSSDWAFNTLSNGAAEEYVQALAGEVTNTNYSNYYTKNGDTYDVAVSYDNSTTYYKKTGWTLTQFGIKYQASAADSNTYILNNQTMTEENARALADVLTSHLPNNATVTGTVANGSQKVVLNVSLPGYYAVYGTAKPNDPSGNEEVVAALGLTTAAPAQTVNPKAEVPTLNKKITNVNEATSGSSQNVTGAVLDADGKAAVAKVGSVVSFEIDSIVPDITGYSDYTFTISDTMSDGLSFTGTDTANVINGLKVYVQTYVADATAFVGGTYYVKSNGVFSEAVATYDSTATYYTLLTVTTDYTINHSVGTKSFTITIPKTVLTAHRTNDAIAVTYDAIVNNAALNTNFEYNTAELTYSNDPSSTSSTTKTPKKSVYVLNINIDVDKVALNESGNKLSGASFKLYRKVGQNTEYYNWDNTNNKVTWTTEKNTGDTFTTNANGALDTQIRGLDKGTYYLLETQAPSGYNLLAAPVEITITATETISNGTTTVTYSADGASVTNGTVELGTQTNSQPLAKSTIVNNTGGLFPSTGGIGTVIFYVVGGALILCSGILLVVRRKVNFK